MNWPPPGPQRWSPRPMSSPRTRSGWPRLALGDAFNLGRVQRVDLVLVLGLLGAHLFASSTSRRRPRRRRRRPRPVPRSCDRHRASAARARCASRRRWRSACLWPLPWISRATSRRASRPSRRNDWRSCSPYFLASRQTCSIAAQQQMRVGRVRHRLGLHCRVDRDPLAGLRAQRAAGHRHPQRFRDQQFKLLRADPARASGSSRSDRTPATSENTPRRKNIANRDFPPPGAHLIIGQSVHVLEQMQPSHQPGRQPRRPCFSL